MADSKKYIGIYDTLGDVQDALDNGQLSNPYVAKTMDNGQIDYNSLSPVDYSQYWCTYYPIDAKIWVITSDSEYYPSTTEYTGGDGKISKADFPEFYCAGSVHSIGSGNGQMTKFKYFQFDSTSNTMYFNYAWNGCSLLTEFPLIDTSNGRDFRYAWNGCSSLTEFPMLDLSAGTNFNSTWQGCSYLKSFPMLDLHNGTDFYAAWYGCSSLTEFPMLDLSAGTNFSYAWCGCSSLTEFPLINTANGTDFSYAWRGCSSLTEFPMLDLHNGTDFRYAWYGCSSLTSFPQLDLSNGTDFYAAWDDCSALTKIGGFGAIKANIDLSDSRKLTVESLMNVINQAAVVTGKTMKLGSTNLAKLSDEQKAVATNKGWTLA